MDEEIISADRHTAEVAALHHEIYELNRLLEKSNRIAADKTTDSAGDPFDNPTEYKHFLREYSDIVPELGTNGYSLPLEPEYGERKNIRRSYSVGGWCILLHFVLAFGLSVVFQNLLIMIMQMFNPSADVNTLFGYAYNSSILVGLNMLIYLIVNVFFGWAGLRLGGFKGRSIISTNGFGIGKALQYCSIALCIWTFSAYASMGIEEILSRFGITSIVDQTGLGETPLALAVSTLYTCIIAPITEEIMFRGMLLRVFSRASQRFAIFATAFFFGLAHGNVPQFVLAFLLGIFLAHITMCHNSIIPAVIVHMFINTFVTLFGFLEDSGETVMLIANMILFAVSFFGVIMLAVFKSGNRIPVATPKQSTRGLYIAVSSVPFCLAVIVQMAYMIVSLVTNK
ncbi:MAG: CPBP family intramembrane metalloprotease [Ruminococcus sp.]|nr:CPBP family intramembrane metalloprotease [Ruminococcus sp.]MDE7225596.1 CPBP family intramembrane metalloprotease [Ruminococcus sp.]